MKKNYITVKELTAADFPPPVRFFWQNAPEATYIRHSMLLAAIVCYCALSPRLRVKYVYDFELSMLLLNLLCIQPSGSGKGLIRWVINLLLKQMILQDKEVRRKAREYREQAKRKGSNKDKGEEPLVAARFLQKFTLPVIVRYADILERKYKDWMTFFLFGNELGAFIENRKASGEFQSVARTAYSLGELYSRDTLYQDGYNAIVDIVWCSVICGQEQALEKYINKDAIVQGDAARQILVISDDLLGEDAPVMKPWTDEQLSIVENTVKTLMDETFTKDDELQPIQEIDMSWLDKDVKAWCQQQRETVLKTGSRAHNSFYVRASVSAFRIATMLWHLWTIGENPSNAIQKKVRKCYYYFAQYILDSALNQWGHEYEMALPKPKEMHNKQPSIYSQLPKRFSRNELRELLLKLELTCPVRTFIYKWRKAKLIYDVPDQPDVYEKLYEA